MEKILRKVSCKDRYPKEQKYYYTDKGELLYHKTHNYFIDSRRNIIDVTDVEFWYEEIELDDLKCNFKEMFSTSKLFAQQRYQKALNYLKNYISPKYDNEMNKALKIAAGLEQIKEEK